MDKFLNDIRDIIKYENGKLLWVHPHLHKTPTPMHTMKTAFKKGKKVPFYRIGKENYFIAHIISFLFFADRYIKIVFQDDNYLNIEYSNLRYKYKVMDGTYILKELPMEDLK